LGSLLITVLAGFGLLLGALGIYGTLAFSVSERVQEIGIRMALGAGRFQIQTMVMQQGLRLSVIATFMGLGAAWGMGRLLQSQLSEVRSTDPVIMCGSACLLLLVACVAIYAPAQRAASLDPMMALRRE
jgi:putative ABC transport system permease protein